MAKFHVNPATGEPGSCNAKKGKCPFASDDEHYASAAEARRAFEDSMMDNLAPSVTRGEAWARHGNLDPNVFLSVVTENEGVLIERFAPDLAEDLEPGVYAVTYRDGDKDKHGLITVTDDGAFTLKNTDKPQPHVSKESQSSEKTQKKVQELFSSIQEIRGFTDAEPEMWDRVEAEQISAEINRCFVKYDWTTSAGATAGRLRIEDVAWVVEHDLALAKRDGKFSTAKVLEETKKALDTFLKR